MSALRDAILPFFNEGDKPQDTEFLQFFLSIWFKDEDIPVERITTLQAQLNELASPIEKFVVSEEGTPYNYTIPAGFYLSDIMIDPAVNCSPWCGYAGGADIIPENDDYVVTEAQGDSWQVHVLATKAARQISIYGLPLDTKIYFIKRKLPE
jgi:hypothetical protein